MKTARNDIDPKEYITTLRIIHINNKDTFTSRVPVVLMDERMLKG